MKTDGICQDWFLTKVFESVGISEPIAAFYFIVSLVAGWGKEFLSYSVFFLSFPMPVTMKLQIKRAVAYREGKVPRLGHSKFAREDGFDVKCQQQVENSVHAHHDQGVEESKVIVRRYPAVQIGPLNPFSWVSIAQSKKSTSDQILIGSIPLYNLEFGSKHNLKQHGSELKAVNILEFQLLFTFSLRLFEIAFKSEQVSGKVKWHLILKE